MSEELREHSFLPFELSRSSESVTSSSTRSILVADPDAGWRELLRKRLASMGMQVHVAGDIASFKTALEIRSPDLVITERVFSDGTWLDVRRELDRSKPDCHCVVVTNNGSIGDAVKAIRAGMSNYLVKPVTPAQVLAGTLSPHPFVGDVSVEAFMSLHRCVYEFLVQSVESHGSMRAAARALHLDRRSLRRMLAKSPPAR
jgi:ActR/RegA family two-component response regulator